MKNGKSVLGAMLLAGFLGPTHAQNPGELDGTFGEGGVAIVSPVSPTSMDNAQCAGVRPTGELVFAGVSGSFSSFDMTVGQLLPDGSLDESFGSMGVTLVGGETGSSFAYDLEILPDGKTLVCGAVSLTAANTALAVWRLLPDGSLDASFADNGQLVVDADEGEDYARQILVGDAGQITVVGASQQPGMTFYRVAMIRFDDSGTLDSGFANGGLQVYPESTTTNYDMRAATLAPDGTMYLAGYTTVSSATEAVVARFDSDGNADMAFGVGGFFSSGEEGRYFDVAYQNGRVLAVGDANNGYDGVVRAHSATGELDVTFGNEGEVLVNPGGANVLLAIEVQADGKLLLGGSASTGFLMRDFLMARLNVDGTFDTDWGTDGITVTVVGPGFEDVNDIVIQPDGKVVAAGFAQFTNNEFVFARYAAGDLGMVLGCTEPAACNYNPQATDDDGTCYGEGDACDDGDPLTENDQYDANCECTGTPPVTAVGHLEGGEFRVFPNPARSHFTLEFAREAQTRTIRLMDLEGKQICHEAANQRNNLLQIGEVAPGAYFIVVEQDGDRTVRQIWIQ
jgi:uncharacterized delta-60 repeat protein